jgi:hypothetical protein
VWHLLSPNSLHYITVSASPTCTPVPRRVPLLHHPAQTLSLSMCAARVCWGREAVGMCVMRARSTPRAAPLSSTVDCLPRLPPHRLHLNVCCQSVVGLGCRLHICGAVCVEYPRVARYAPCGRPDRHPCPPSSTPSPPPPTLPTSHTAHVVVSAQGVVGPGGGGGGTCVARAEHPHAVTSATPAPSLPDNEMYTR